MARIRATRKTPIIGLTGGIGAGKTLVGQVLESLGAAVIDFDRLAHEELRRVDVLADLRRWWGDGICTPRGEPDHGAIAAIVFGDPSELARLEDRLYPGILRTADRMMADLARNPMVRAIVLDAPKLYEAGLDRLCDTVIFVDADWTSRAQRVAEARGWSPEELRRRENLQNPLDAKRASADHVVTNHSGIDALRSQVERVFSSVLVRYRGTGARRHGEP